jgi:hypothetical protein
MPAPDWSSDLCAGTVLRAHERRPNAVDLVEIDRVERLDLGGFFLPSLLVAVATVVVGLTHRVVSEQVVRLNSEHPFPLLDLATSSMTVSYAEMWVPVCAVVSAAGFTFACRGTRRMTAVGRVEAGVWMVCMTLGAIAILPMAIMIVLLMTCVAGVVAAMAGLFTLTTFVHHR